jgi:hypothetical protein
MQSPARTPIDYPAYIQKARLLRAEAFAAALAELRHWLRAGETMRAAHTR